MKFCEVGDAKELSVMARDIWMEYYSTFLDADLPNYVVTRFQSEEAIIEQMHHGYLYSFIMDGDAKVGYLCIVPEDDSLFMSKLYLYKDSRGNGLGSKALDDILEEGRARKKKRVYLRVNKYNTASMKVYQRKGFVVAEDIYEDIGDGFFLDDYLMEYRF